MTTVTNEVKQSAISKAQKNGFIFSPSSIDKSQYDTILDCEHQLAIEFLANIGSKLSYKLIKDVNVNKHSSDQNISFELPIDGYYESQGEYHYNQKMKRFEHDVIDSDGSKYLAIWN